MKKIILLIVLLTNITYASIKIDTTYNVLGAITQEIGGDLVNVKVLANPKYDPHFIVPKPSLISKLRHADLLIMNGGGLEMGWLPPLLKSANNPKIQPGANGFLDMSHFIVLMDKPSSVSRAFGDIHADGNPHYTLDPYTVLIIAKVISKKLEFLDSQNTKTYKKNLKNFLLKWDTYLKNLDSRMSLCKDKKVIQYHELYNYFLKRYNYVSYGDIEPLPGISPSSKHTIKLISLMKKNDVKTILQDSYHERKTAKFIADKTKAIVKIIPHDIGSVDKSDNLEDFYNNIADKLCN
ncbi:MAG: metal ABC transporter substrate-binding protein [Sulfurimonas sp.]|nr:MAG: metal ABC transporter substrate-binding protein [Sulfurimonas sp.]